MPCSEPCFWPSAYLAKAPLPRQPRHHLLGFVEYDHAFEGFTGPAHDLVKSCVFDARAAQGAVRQDRIPSGAVITSPILQRASSRTSDGSPLTAVHSRCASSSRGVLFEIQMWRRLPLSNWSSMQAAAYLPFPVPVPSPRTNSVR